MNIPSWIEDNTKKNIKKAHSLEKEVRVFRSKLHKIQKKYWLRKDPSLKKSMEDINEIITILDKIQTDKIKRKTADYIISVAISDLKKIKNRVQRYLAQIKAKMYSERQKYNLISKNISKELNKIVFSFSSFYNKKEIKTTKDKRVILLVKSLHSKSKDLERFNKYTFNSTHQVKQSLINKVKRIIQNMSDIKNALKK